jgi:hypothetical protein
MFIKILILLIIILKDCGAGDYEDFTSQTEKYKRYNYRII